MHIRRDLVFSLPFFLLFLLVMTQSAWLYRNGGPENTEHSITIPHLLSAQPLLPKLFDIEHNEGPSSRDNFQARELSYLTDYLDLECLILFARHGLAHFLSTIKYLFVGAILVLGWIAFTRHFALPQGIAALCLLLFLTSSPVYHGVYFHHTAKIGVALFAFAFAVWVHRYLTREERPSTLGDWLTGFGLMTALALFDMQGFFLCLLATVLIARAAISHHRLRFLLSSAVAATLIHVLYRYRLGYDLIHYFHGYRPQAAFQNPQWRLLLSPRDLSRSVRLFLEYFRLFFGSVPYPVAGLSLAAALAYHLAAGEAGMIVALVVIGLTAMTFLMATQFFLLYSPEMSLIYYSLPSTALFLFGLGLTLKRAWREGPAVKVILTVTLLALVVNNYRSLPSHQRVLDQANLGSSPYMAEMVKALREEVERPLSPRLAKDPVFLSLRRQMQP